MLDCFLHPSHHHENDAETRTLQLTERPRKLLPPATGAVSSDFQSRHDNMKSALSLQLLFQRVKRLADKLGNFAAPHTGHVDVIASQLSLVVMTFTIYVHQVEFIDQTLPLKQANGPIHCASINRRIHRARLAQDLARVQMFRRRFDYAQNRPSLASHANASLRQLHLQSPGNLGSWKRHREFSPCSVAKFRK